MTSHAALPGPDSPLTEERKLEVRRKVGEAFGTAVCPACGRFTSDLFLHASFHADTRHFVVEAMGS